MTKLEKKKAEKEKAQEALNEDEMYEKALLFAQVLIRKNKADEELAFYLCKHWEADHGLMEADLKVMEYILNSDREFQGVNRHATN